MSFEAMICLVLLALALHCGGCSCEEDQARRMYLRCVEEGHGRKDCEPLLRGLGEPPPEAQDVVSRETEGR
jgi:hypothetical protein